MKVFLSYSRADVEMVAKVSNILERESVEVWRDEEDIEAGTLWPKKIAEGLQGADAVVLFWSANTVDSHWVDFELNSALAMRKLVIPVLIGGQALPDMLRATHALPYTKPKRTADDILRVLGGQKPVVDKGDAQAVGQRIAALPPAMPDKADQALRDLIRQEGWNVKGDIHQTITINIHPPDERKPAPGKPWYERWHFYVGIALGIVTIYFTLMQVLKKEPEKVSAPPHCHLRGNVVDADDQPVGGLEVWVNDDPALRFLMPSTGGFSFDSVPGDCGRDQVRLYFYRDGKAIWNEYVVLPGPHKVRLNSAALGR